MKLINKEAVVLETLPLLKWLKTNISGENKDSPRIINLWSGAGAPGKQWVQQGQSRSEQGPGWYTFTTSFHKC